MIEQNQVYTLEFQNFRRKHANRADSELFLIEMEITEAEWHYLQSFPRDAIGNCAIQWTERAAITEKPEKPAKQAKEPKPKKEPTPYGQFWRDLDKAGFHNRPDVRQWINYDGSDEAEAKERMRILLEVDKRSLQASPERLLATLRKDQRATCADYLAGAITTI
jgi:hypothetical protein